MDRQRSLLTNSGQNDRPVGDHRPVSRVPPVDAVDVRALSSVRLICTARRSRARADLTTRDHGTEAPGEDRAADARPEHAVPPDTGDGWNSGRDAWDHWDENAWDLERWQETSKEKPAIPLPRRNGGVVGRHAVEAEDKPPVDPHDSPMRIEGSPDEVYGAAQVMDWNQMPVAGQGYQVSPVVDDTQRQMPVPAAPSSPTGPPTGPPAGPPASDDEIAWWNETSRDGTDADHHEDLFHGHTDLPQRQAFGAPPVPEIPELGSGPSFNGFVPSQPSAPEPYESFVPAAATAPIPDAPVYDAPGFEAPGFEAPGFEAPGFEPPVFDEYQDLRSYAPPGEYDDRQHSGQFARQAVPPPSGPPPAEEPAEEEGRRIPLLLIAAIVGLVLVGVGVWTKWPRDDVSQASPRPGSTLTVGPVIPPADGSNALPVGPTDTPSAELPTTPGTAPTTKKAAPQPTPTTHRPPTSGPTTSPPAPSPSPSSPSPSPSPSPESPSPETP